MKRKTPEQKIRELCKDIRQEITNWKHLNKNGGQDPFWSDGANMNLTRNHITYAKRQIEELCEESGQTLPEEYFLPTPPEVDNYYMANLKQKERIQRIGPEKITTKRNKYDEEQLSLF